MITATKIFEVSYSHYLPDYDGNCNNLHGHNATIEITFGKVANAPKGMVADFKDIKKDVKPIVDSLDHAYLNDIIDNPTAESMAMYLVGRIYNELPEYGDALRSIRVWETSDSYVEWRVST